jgi:hypothetical protein
MLRVEKTRNSTGRARSSATSIGQDDIPPEANQQNFKYGIGTLPQIGSRRTCPSELLSARVSLRPCLCVRAGVYAIPFSSSLTSLRGPSALPLRLVFVQLYISSSHDLAINSQSNETRNACHCKLKGICKIMSDLAEVLGWT